MEVTINIPNFLLFLTLGILPGGEDKLDVIGDSRLAYLPPGHPFSTPAKWHDAAYLRDWPGRAEGWRREMVDRDFLEMMLTIAGDDLELTKEAIALYLIVREKGEPWWEN